MAQVKKYAHIGGDCVACGNCVQYCAQSAISMDRGLCAKVNADLCIGCGKCAQSCPADVITLQAREVRAV